MTQDSAQELTQFFKDSALPSAGTSLTGVGTITTEESEPVEFVLNAQQFNQVLRPALNGSAQLESSDTIKLVSTAAQLDSFLDEAINGTSFDVDYDLNKIKFNLSSVELAPGEPLVEVTVNQLRALNSERFSGVIFPTGDQALFKVVDSRNNIAQFVELATRSNTSTTNDLALVREFGLDGGSGAVCG